MTYFETLQQALEYVDSKYPHLKVFAQIPTVELDCGEVFINYGHASFWEEASLIDGTMGWTYNY